MKYFKLKLGNSCYVEKALDDQHQAYEMHVTMCGTLFNKMRREMVETYLDTVCTKEKVFLNTGCGKRGYYVRYAACKYRQSWGLDARHEAIKRARMQTGNFDNICYVIANAEALPFRTGSFDVIRCSEVLEHVLHPEKCIEEISRVLSKNGCLIISVPTETSCVFSPLWKLLVRINLIKSKGYGHLRSFHAKAFLHLIHEFGFKGVNSNGVHVYFLESLLRRASRVSRTLGSWLDRKLCRINIVLHMVLVHSPLRYRGVTLIVLAKKLNQERNT